MSDFNDTTDIDSGDSREDMRERRRLADENKAAREEAAALKRENLFLRAGVDPTSKLGALLLKTFDGDDPEALKKEASDLGYQFGAPTTTQIPASEASQQQLREQLNGGTPGGGPTPRPPEGPAALADFHRAIESGIPRERAAQDVAARLIGAGMAGDRSLLFDRNAHFEAAAMLDRAGMGGVAR